jgi:uncharacterized protein (DUF2141 family)
MYQLKNQKTHYFYYFIALLFQCLIISCAQTSAPTGGPKDTTPPKITKSNPANFSTNFKENEINISFDEWILPFTNPQAQIIISPDVQPFPKVEAARNDLSIKFKDSLQSNTTYSIFFGDNLKDNNEGNPYPNFKYIFSTGNFIDSLQVKGSINSSLDKIPDNTYLLVYKDLSDTAFTKKRPFYITKIDNNGSFKLENLKEGDYKIYALSDKNGNYFYDLPNEVIGFTDSIFHIQSNLDTLNFTIFQPEDSVFRIFSYDRVVNDGILHVMLNKELSYTNDEITTYLANDTSFQTIAFQKKDLNLAKDAGSEILVYLPNLKSDTNNLTVIIKNNGKIIDSVKFKTDYKKAKNPILFFNDTTAYKTLTVFEYNSFKLIASNYSLSSIDTSRIYITDTSKQKIPFNISRNDDLQTYVITAAWKPDMKYKIQFLDSALSDLIGNYNKIQEISFSALSIKKGGNLLITYELPQKSSQYIAYLKDNSGKVLDKQILRDSQTVKINYGLQKAGTFSVELIDDTNKNGIWNSGNYATKTLPEKIYNEPKPILIKENWDAEETIKVDFNIKTKIINKNSNIEQNSPETQEIPKNKFNNFLNNTNTDKKINNNNRD